MRMNGVKLECPNEAILVLPRPDGNLVFRAKAVMDYDEFDKICPEPKAPTKIVKGGKKEVNIADPDYIRAVMELNENRMAWIVLKSLSATEGLEWESVNMLQPDSWKNYVQELKDSGFSVIEINKIVGLALEANALDEGKLESARQAFLAGQGMA
jgi:hypothetical protein